MPLSLSSQEYKWVLMLGVTLQWIIIPSRLKEKYSKLLHATETFYNGHLSTMAISSVTKLAIVARFKSNNEAVHV